MRLVGGVGVTIRWLFPFIYVLLLLLYDDPRSAINIICAYVNTYARILNKVGNIRQRGQLVTFFTTDPVIRQVYLNDPRVTKKKKITISYSSDVALSRENTFDGFRRIRVVRARRTTRRKLVKYEYNRAVSRLRLVIGENWVEKKSEKSYT